MAGKTNRYDRRSQDHDRHKLSVTTEEDDTRHVSVICSCGRPVPMRRPGDRTMVSMSDMLELFRIHLLAEVHGIRENRAAPQ